MTFFFVGYFCYEFNYTIPKTLPECTGSKLSGLGLRYHRQVRAHLTLFPRMVIFRGKDLLSKGGGYLCLDS